MNSKTFLRVLFIGVLSCIAAGCGNSGKTDSVEKIDTSSQTAPPPRDATDVLNDVRLRQLTKELELTSDQQAQLKSMFQEESKEIAKIRAQADSSITDQAVKVAEAKKATYEKLKPLLTPAQLEKFERSATRKKK